MMIVGYFYQLIQAPDIVLLVYVQSLYNIMFMYAIPEFN